MSGFNMDGCSLDAFLVLIGEERIGGSVIIRENTACQCTVSGGIVSMPSISSALLIHLVLDWLSLNATMRPNGEVDRVGERLPSASSRA